MNLNFWRAVAPSAIIALASILASGTMLSLVSDPNLIRAEVLGLSSPPSLPVLITAIPLISLLMNMMICFLASFDKPLTNFKGGLSFIRKITVAIAFLFLGSQLGAISTAVFPEMLPFNSMLFVSLGVFLMITGIAMRDLPFQSAFGFRLPWAQRNSQVWARTHDLFYRWFVVIGVLYLFLAGISPLPEYSMILLLLALIVPTLLSFRFSRKIRPQS